MSPLHHVRRNVPVNSKKDIDKGLDYLQEEDIILHQIEPTTYVSLATYPKKLNSKVKVCLDLGTL